MTIELPEQKRTPPITRYLYGLFRLLPLSTSRKLALALDMDWVLYHLAHDYSRKIFPFNEHPKRIATLAFLEKHITPDKTILDLGCGSGGLTNALALMAHSATGVDLIKEHVDRATQVATNPSLNFIVADLLDYANSYNGSVDVVTLSHVVGEIDDPVSLFLRLNRITSSVFIEADDFESNRLNHYRLLLPHTAIFTDSSGRRMYDRDGLVQDIEKGGLIIKDEECRHGVLRYWCHTQSSTAQLHS